MIQIKDKKNFLSIFLIIFLSLVLSLSIEKFQYALDGGYVLSGLVEYPDNSPMKYYYLNSWTFLHQFSALLLKLGFNGNFISVIILFLSSCFYSLGVFFVSKIITRTTLFPLILTFSVLILGKNFGDTDYPSLIFSEHSFGMVSFALCTLILGLIANNNIFLSSFSLGFLICIHPVIGIWMIALFLLILIYNKKKFENRSLTFGFVLGLFASILSLYFYSKTFINFGNTNEQLYKIFLDNWDGHRNTETGLHYEYLIKSFLLLVMLFIYKSINSKDITKNLEILINYILILIIESISFYLLYKIIPNIFPEILIKVMPSRFLMIYSFLGWPIIISIIYFLIFNKFNFKKKYLNFILCFIILIPLFQKNKKIITLINNFNYSYKEKDEKIFKQIKNLNTTGHILSTTSLNYDLLRKSNKPFLFDTNSFDFLPYHAHLIDNIDLIFKDIFDINIREKPKIKNSYLSDSAIKKSYQRKTLKEWKNIFKKYNIDYLVVPADWQINLKQIAENNKISIYSIE